MADDRFCEIFSCHVKRVVNSSVAQLSLQREMNFTIKAAFVYYPFARFGILCKLDIILLAVRVSESRNEPSYIVKLIKWIGLLLSAHV